LKLARDGVSAQEREDAVTHLQDSAIYARDSLRGPAQIIGAALSTGAELDEIESWPLLIGAVTATDIQNAAAKYLQTDADTARYVTGHLLPKEQESAL